jgi:hypothetical protein
MRKFLPFVFFLIMLCACAPSKGDYAVAKDSANLYSEFGQFPIGDPRSNACVVDKNQTLFVIDTGFETTWDFTYIKVRSAECADGRVLFPALGALSEFRKHKP